MIAFEFNPFSGHYYENAVDLNIAINCKEIRQRQTKEKADLIEMKIVEATELISNPLDQSQITKQFLKSRPKRWILQSSFPAIHIRWKQFKINILEKTWKI